MFELINSSVLSTKQQIHFGGVTAEEHGRVSFLF